MDLEEVYQQTMHIKLTDSGKWQMFFVTWQELLIVIMSFCSRDYNFML
jgi:hypothetical protein